MLRLFLFPLRFSVLHVNAVSQILHAFMFRFVRKFRPVYIRVIFPCSFVSVYRPLPL